MKIKTEHNGPKRGKGYWGTKTEAKTASKKRRRSIDKKICKKQPMDFVREDDNPKDSD